jgi:hypothetical protein
MVLVKIGKHPVPLWVLTVVIASLVAGVLGLYVVQTLTLNVRVTEPIEVLNYPSTITLYPGETVNFSVTIQNHASLNYTVFLGLHLENATYEHDYVNFSSLTYFVHPGVQSLTAWLAVSGNAPSTDATLKIDLTRIAGGDDGDQFTFVGSESYNVVAVYFEGTSGSGTNSIVIRVQNTGSAQFTIDTNAKVNGMSKTLAAMVNIAAAAVVNVTIPNVGWSNGNQYSMELVTTRGNKIPYVAVAPQT